MSPRNGPVLGPIVQHSFLVPDLDHAMVRWQTLAGAGPFHVFRQVALEVDHRGVRRPLTLSLALAQTGSTHVELIQQHNHGPSVFVDVFPDGGPGLHHVARQTSDLDATRHDLESRGHPVAMSLMFGETPVTYVDTTAELGFMTELLSNDPTTTGLLAMVAEAARDWDGSDPVRELG